MCLCYEFVGLELFFVHCEPCLRMVQACRLQAIANCRYCGPMQSVGPIKFQYITLLHAFLNADFKQCHVMWTLDYTPYTMCICSLKIRNTSKQLLLNYLNLDKGCKIKMDYPPPGLLIQSHPNPPPFS